MKKTHQPTTLQETFGAKFLNGAVIVARPEGMDFKEYKRLRRDQTKFIRQNHA
jgi:hypothetical protein